MANGGQMETAALVAMLSERAPVKVKLALVADAQQWRLQLTTAPENSPRLLTTGR
jgi:hypothetical protein